MISRTPGIVIGQRTAASFVALTGYQWEQDGNTDLQPTRNLTRYADRAFQPVVLGEIEPTGAATIIDPFFEYDINGDIQPL